jgi:hypothetical protein
VSVLPQLNHENRLYEDLKSRVKRFLTTGDVSPVVTSPAGKITPPPAPGGKSVAKKK